MRCHPRLGPSSATRQRAPRSHWGYGTTSCRACQGGVWPCVGDGGSFVAPAPCFQPQGSNLAARLSTLSYRPASSGLTVEIQSGVERGVPVDREQFFALMASFASSDTVITP